jgi:hypothetical protein
VAVEIDQLEQQLAAPALSQSAASTHVQTDDVDGVRRAIVQFMPRVGHTEWSEVSEAEHGWVTVTDELCDRDRSAQRRLGAELSERMGVPVVALALEENAVVRFLLFDRGRMVDEYLSVPTYYGDLNKADELSLAANATLVARLTGADPARGARGRAHGVASVELPPAPELLEQIAEVMNSRLGSNDDHAVRRGPLSVLRAHRIALARRARVRGRRDRSRRPPLLGSTRKTRSACAGPRTCFVLPESAVINE